jgi:signal transduction histidine kinase
MLIFRCRLLEMRRTADAIFEGDLSRRVPVDGTGTAFDLQAQGFNRMLDRINELMDEVRNVTNGVAHELRTPLARLRNELSLIAHDPGAQAVKPRIEGAQAQADGLLALFSSLLRIAEVDSGARRANFASIDLAGLVRECADTLAAVVDESGHEITALLLAPVVVDGDEQLLSQMIINLIENVVRHTPSGTHIRIALSGSAAGWATLVVEDDGPGIASADRDKALDRFGRLSGRQAEGHGFGLPLVASIARLHGGSIELGDAQPGLRVTVRLPSA